MEVYSSLDYVYKCLSKAKTYGLEAEIMCSALERIKLDNNMSIEDALQYACIEWDVY